jgi:hypothetical protein
MTKVFYNFFKCFFDLDRKPDISEIKIQADFSREVGKMNRYRLPKKVVQGMSDVQLDQYLDLSSYNLNGIQTRCPHGWAEKMKRIILRNYASQKENN